MNKILLIARLLILLVGASQVTASAQTDEPLVPIIRAPTGPMKWTMTIEREKDFKPEMMDYTYEPSSIATERDGKWVHAVVTFANVPPQEYWLQKKYFLLQIAPNRVEAYVPTSGDLPYPYYTAGFYGIEHTNSADEKPKTAFEGVMCRYFQGSNYEAWFDAKTGLPRAFRKHFHTFRFQFAPPPSELTLPPLYKAAADNYDVRHS
jgi:hypothetical protein